MSLPGSEVGQSDVGDPLTISSTFHQCCLCQWEGLVTHPHYSHMLRPKNQQNDGISCNHLHHQISGHVHTRTHTHTHTHSDTHTTADTHTHTHTHAHTHTHTLPLRAVLQLTAADLQVSFLSDPST